MRICHILESSGGGSGQVVVDLLMHGIGTGDELTLIYSPLRAEPDFLTAIKNMEGKVRLLPLNMRHRICLNDALMVFQLYFLLRANGPFDIIHSHSSKAGALSRLTRLLMPRTKQVYAPHAFMSMAPNASAAYGWIERWMSVFADVTICVSEHEKRHALERLGIAGHRLKVVPNGVHLDYPAQHDDARRELGAQKGDFVVGFVGRLVPQKNPLKLIEVFAQVAKQEPSLRLAIVGDGPLKASAEAALAQQGLQGRARFFSGYKGRDLMPGFDCLVCSSDYESFGLVILEALAAGIPVISTPVGIAEDAITQGDNGFVTRDFSAVQLAEALGMLIKASQQKRSDMSKAARENARKYSVRHMADGTRAIYKSLLNNIA